jgi:hypothetical protein
VDSPTMPYRAECYGTFRFCYDLDLHWRY